MEFECQRNYHKGQAAVRPYACPSSSIGLFRELGEPSFNLRFKLYFELVLAAA